MNEAARARMGCAVRLDVGPGAAHLFEEPGMLREVARRATGWRGEHLAAPRPIATSATIDRGRAVANPTPLPARRAADETGMAHDGSETNDGNARHRRRRRCWCWRCAQFMHVPRPASAPGARLPVPAAMRIVSVPQRRSLDDYAAHASLAAAVAALREDAARLAPVLRGRTVWMVSSTEAGGGVAEMLPGDVALLRELGVACEWAVIETDRTEFFRLTKRLHNLVHGEPAPEPTAADRTLYDAVSRDNAAALAAHVRPTDLVVVHDPQPLGVGALLASEHGTPALWRCHIGLERSTPETRAAWAFLEPYARRYGRAVFSATEYVPPFLAGSADVIAPAIDPLDHKNRDLSLHKLVGVLANAGLLTAHWPVVTPPFADPARRVQVDGTLAPATQPEDLALIAGPVVTQVSRWDRLKGFGPLLDAFRLLRLERNGRFAPPAGGASNAVRERRRRQLDAARLLLVGPDPDAIQDDPEALDVLDQLRHRYVALEPDVQRVVAILALPMRSRKENALMVNALQRASSVVVQNSLREGFGLTVAEAMWKRVAVLGSARACGIRQQLRDGVEGRLVGDPEDPEALASAIAEMVVDENGRAAWGRNGRRRVHEEFLNLRQLRRWLRLLARAVR